MNLSELTKFLVSQIISDSELISVKEFDMDDIINIEVLIPSNEIAPVIGVGGKTAKAIRTIVQATAYANKLKKVKINFDAF